MDDMSPRDAVFYELAPESRELPDHYGTGRVPEQRSHSRWIALLLLLLVSANVITLAVFLRLWNEESAQPAPEQENPDLLTPVRNGEELPQGDDLPEEIAQIKKGTKAMPLTEIYNKISPSLTVVTAYTHDGIDSGTGLVLTEDGYILTNASTVINARSLEITLADGQDYTASYVGMDAASDLAVLKIQGQGLKPAEFGDSDAMRPGDEIVAFSNPFGAAMSSTMSEGIISAVDNNVTLGGTPTCIFQTNVSLLSEGTGGILVNSGGQVIAVGLRQVGSFVSYESVDGIGFALPSAEVSELINDLILYGSVSGRASLGLEVAELSEPQQLFWNLPDGVIVNGIDEGSSAYACGIREGDVLLAIGETTLVDVASYMEALNRYSAGDRVRVLLYRGGARYYADVILDESGA